MVSFIGGVFGGYTIANGVVIENATGGSGDDALMGNEADNVLKGNSGDDTLLGRGGDDQLRGDSGKDDLRGGEGDDTLNGGPGDDVLIGGTSSDIFVFTDPGTDTIADYQKGEKIDLSGLEGVTFADVSWDATTITVDLEGPDDLMIIIGNTRWLSESDFLFA